MRLLPWVSLGFAVLPCLAWDTAPHQRITRAALAALPQRLVDRFGAEAGPLAETYCMYPDRYNEMESYGFVRKSPGPRTAAEIRSYCLRPDGELIHGATGDRESDTGTLVFLFERIVSNLSVKNPGEAAKYAGVLSHFIADSLSPPHSAGVEGKLHAVLERSLPEFALARAPGKAGKGIVDSAQSVLRRCYQGAERNRRELPVMIRIAEAGDEKALEPYLLRAGRDAAGILADALFTLTELGQSAR